MIARRGHGLEYRAMKSAMYACFAVGVVFGRFSPFWWAAAGSAIAMVVWHGYRYVTREADQP